MPVQKPRVSVFSSVSKFEFFILLGTNINDALSKGLELIQGDDDKGYASLVIFLTDGAATEGETDQSKILDNISSINKNNVPIFSLSFGEDADYGFLKKMSAQNDGFVRKIYEASDASLQLTGFYGEIASTLLSNLTFQYLDDTIVGKSITNTIYPSFFEGSEIVIAGHISELNVSAMNLEVCGTSSKGPLEWRTSTGNNIYDLIQDAPSESIASNFSDITEKIWAYMSIKQVLIRRLRERNNTARMELKKKALDLALKVFLCFNVEVYYSAKIFRAYVTKIVLWMFVLNTFGFF